MPKNSSTTYNVSQGVIKPPGNVTNFAKVLSDPTQTLHHFELDDLAMFKRAHEFDPRDSKDFRNFYVGKDDVHGVLKYLLVRTSTSLKINMFGYDDEELDAIISAQLKNAHVFVQGTLDRSQAGGVHEKKILQAWDEAMRNSFAIGQSKTHQISHTKGFVADGKVGLNGSTNWSTSGEGIFTQASPDAPGGPGYKAQNNTITVFCNPVEVHEFSTSLDEEHSIALQQEIARQKKEGQDAASAARKSASEKRPRRSKSEF